MFTFFKRISKPTPQFTFQIRKSNLRDQKRKPIFIIERSFNSFFLTSELTVQETKQQPLEVLAYLLAKDSKLLELIQSNQKNKIIQINKQYFDIGGLDLDTLKEHGIKRFEKK